MGAGSLIRVEDLHRYFRIGQEIVRALDGISLDLAPGEFLGISGASGSGKSTLMYLLGGLDRPTSGHIWVRGEDLAALDEDGLANYRRRMVGFIFQMFNLIPSLTALENVEFPMLFSGLPATQRRQRSVQALGQVGLEGRLHHRPTELSGGQQQRVAIARALVNDPAMILADEPTGNLDSRSGAEVLELLKQLNDEGRTILIVSHDANVIAGTTRSIHLHDGKMAAAGRAG